MTTKNSNDDTLAPGTPDGSAISSVFGDESSTVPYEAIPALAANTTFIEKSTRLRELKLQLDAAEEEFKGLRLEVMAMAMVHGVKSVSIGDLRVADTRGRTTKGKVVGATLIDTLETLQMKPLSIAQYAAIAESAKECDPQTLAQGGIPVAAIVAAKSPDSVAANSIRVEWIGARGKNAKSMKGTKESSGVQ